MVGPVLKVDPSMRCRAGQTCTGSDKRDYAELPAICKGFDVCLMPFALNEATEFINPTKSLEYMATGRPIVSTAVPDVVRNFGSVVKIARSHEEFIRCAAKRIETGRTLRPFSAGSRWSGANSWDSIVAKLEHHMHEALAREALNKGHRMNGFSEPGQDLAR